MLFPIPSQTMSKESPAAETKEHDAEDMKSSSTSLEVLPFTLILTIMKFAQTAQN